MKVLIDAAPLVLRSAGVKNYLYYWIGALRRQSAAVGTFPRLPAPLPPLAHENSLLGALPTAGAVAALHLRLARWLSADVFHATNQTRAVPRGCRLSATLFDLTAWLMPELHTPANVAAERRFARLVLDRADGLIAISEQTQADALRVLRLPPERIAVIYPGVAEAFFTAAPRRRARPYLLFTGTLEPRKNVDTLLDAWQLIPPSLRAGVDLLLAGSRGWAAAATLARLAAPPPGVVALGYVPEEDLPGLTRGALAAVYPSLYEGFGLPVAQAMAAGVPVVTSNVSSLPEVAGGGALLADPRSAAELAVALTRVLESPGLRAQLAAAGRARATSLYRWERAAAASLRFFAALLNR